MSYGSEAHLSKAVESVAVHIPSASIAIQEHAADASGVERVAGHARSLGTTVRTRHDPTNPGFGAGCNALAAGSSASWLLFLNPDARIVGWDVDLEQLPKDVIQGPAHVGAPRPDAHRGRTFTVRDEIAWSWLRRTGPPPDGTGFVSGAALLISAEAFGRLGGFDPGYFMFYEDIDLCLRANEIEIGTELLSGFSIDHTGAHSTSVDPGAALRRSYESGCRFHARRGHSLAAYRAYVAVDAIARACFHTLRGRRPWAAAYGRLARRACVDAIRRAAP